MEFWGVEVKAGEPLKVKPELSKFIHLSQAVLGETKKDKGDDSIIINVKVGNQKLVLGHLSLNNLKQLQFDLVFEKEFELSHNWKKGSVYFSGYQSAYGDDSDDFDDSDLGDSEEEEEELIPANAIPNGKPAQNGEQAKKAINKVNASKPQASEKPKIKVAESSEDDDSDSDEDDESDDDEDEIEELMPANAIQNGKPSQKGEQAKPATAKANASKPQVSEKPKVKVVEPIIDDDSDDDDLDEDDDDESDEDEEGSEDESDEDMLEADSDEDDEIDEKDDEIDEKDEETPKKAQVQSGKKRPNESASKTLVSAKKVKADTPQKTGGKKEGHVVTPHPAKKAGKTPSSAEKSKAQTPKSSGQISCKSCTKTFGSETALGSHTKAKHA